LITRAGWQWWPFFLVPFAIVGLALAVKIWNDLPAATRRYISNVENKTENRLPRNHS
jgi:OPA family glycerol-3-phosphate transporter-like MFS transporter